MTCDSYCYTVPIRHIIIALLFFSLSICYTHRVVMDVAIVEIKNQSKNNDELKWSKREQHLVLMGFYIGYCLAHVAAGYLVDRFGARHPMLWGNLLSAVANAVIPLVAHTHSLYVFLLRFLMGIGQAPLLPSCSSLIDFWIPQHSRAVTCVLTFAGVPLGTFLGIYLTGVCTVFFEDWKIVFYGWSFLTIPWCLFFAYYIYSYPVNHPRLQTIGSSYNRSSFIQCENAKISLKTFASSKEMWAETISTFGHTYLLFTLVTYLPRYISETLNYNLSDVSWLASLPFAIMGLTSFLTRQLNIMLVNDKNISKELLRKVNSTCCHLLAAASVFGATVAGHRIYLSLSLFTIGAAALGFFYGGNNLLDHSSEHSAFITSVINGIASISGIACTTVAFFVVKDDTLFEWQIVFGIALAVACLSWILDLSFGDAHYELEMNSFENQNKPKKWYQELPDEDFKVSKEKRQQSLIRGM